MTELERDTLDRVTGHLETWANDHPDERTSEIDAAIYCARQLLRASLSPAATPVSEAGPDWMEAQQVRKRRGVEIMQEYAWGNLTPLGVANHLKRAGFNIDYAQKIANDLAKPASSPAGVDVVQTLIDKTEKLIEAAEYGPYTPKPSPWWHPNLADAHSKNPPEAEHG